MENKELMVTIPLNLYNDLLEIKFKQDRLLINLEDIIDKSELNWRKNDLDFDAEKVRNFLKGIVPHLYKNRVKELNNKGDEN